MKNSCNWYELKRECNKSILKQLCFHQVISLLLITQRYYSEFYNEYLNNLFLERISWYLKIFFLISIIYRSIDILIHYIPVLDFYYSFFKNFFFFSSDYSLSNYRLHANSWSRCHWIFGLHTWWKEDLIQKVGIINFIWICYSKIDSVRFCFNWKHNTRPLVLLLSS